VSDEAAQLKLKWLDALAVTPQVLTLALVY
jgi:hypothetical protein